MMYKNQTSSESQDKANFFNEFFYSSFNGSLYPFPDIQKFKKNNDNLNYLRFTYSDVCTVLTNLDLSKATGPDGIPAIFLEG